VVLFGRVLDKIRLAARGALPPEFHQNLGEASPELLDAQCCRFLGVAYAALRARTLQGGCDEEVLSWAQAGGAARSDEACAIWNRYMTKWGWRDDHSDALREDAAQYGLAARRPETVFELFDLDEERPAGATRSWEAPPLSLLILMGVSGSGKSTLGLDLAAALSWDFVDSDALHPAANVAKMSAGIPLEDADRMPWIAAIRAELGSRAARGARCVLAFSALKQAYRDALTPDPAARRYVHLRGDPALIRGRLAARRGHFMKAGLLASQYETLEEPLDALALDVAGAPGVLIARIREVFQL
jgi:gluconokinase